MPLRISRLGVARCMLGCVLTTAVLVAAILMAVKIPERYKHSLQRASPARAEQRELGLQGPTGDNKQVSDGGRYNNIQ